MNDFQTPIWCCQYMKSLVPEGVKEILEPTPGSGNLVNVLKHDYSVVSPIDFWHINTRKRFDCIVMNPPFSPMRLGYKILYRCMDMSDNIIALLPWLTIINSEQRTKDIFGFGLRSVTHLPRKTFPGTRVQTCILQMQRGYHGDTVLMCIEKKDLSGDVNKWI